MENKTTFGTFVSMGKEKGFEALMQPVIHCLNKKIFHLFEQIDEIIKETPEYIKINDHLTKLRNERKEIVKRRVILPLKQSWNQAHHTDTLPDGSQVYYQCSESDFLREVQLKKLIDMFENTLHSLRRPSEKNQKNESETVQELRKEIEENENTRAKVMQNISASKASVLRPYKVGEETITRSKGRENLYKIYQDHQSKS